MEKICIITLGCKTNQYESQALGELLEKEGFAVTYSHEPADIYILNTCAVTNEAERKSRQHVSKLLKLNSSAKVYICGCAGQNNPKQFEQMPAVELVVGNAGQLAIFEKITGRQSQVSQAIPNVYEDIQITKPVNARAYVKIQDGCNRFCSYCLIPHLRGRSRSRSIVSILQEVDTLKKAGAKEIILTGVDISDYKIDDQPALLDLLVQLNTFGVRFRLSSFEPNILTEDFVKTLASLKNFCPHFHISMQSGSTSVLKRMNRHYTAKFFIQRAKLIRKYFLGSAITTDVILGFPGETKKEFKETLKTIKKVAFAEMHIFPYSRRAGTTADTLLETRANPEFIAVDPIIVKARMKTALALAKKLKNKYLKSQIGTIHEIVVEQQKGEYIIGTTENYVKVFIPATSACPMLSGSLQKVRLLAPLNDGILGEIID